jgi:hypothetical protein
MNFLDKTAFGLVSEYLPKVGSPRGAVKMAISNSNFKHSMAMGDKHCMSMLAACSTMAVNPDFEALDAIFVHQAKEAQASTDVETTLTARIGDVYNNTVRDASRSGSGKFGLKLLAVENTSLYRTKVEDKTGVSVEKSFKCQETYLDWMRNDLRKPEMAFNAKCALMNMVGAVVIEAMGDKYIDNEFLNRNPLAHKDGRFKWGLLFGCIYHMGAAYKAVHHRTDDEGRDPFNLVEWAETKINKYHFNIRENDDVGNENGHYVDEQQEEINLLALQVEQWRLIAPYAVKLHPLIDLWNMIEDWSWSPSSGYKKIVLNKIPPDMSEEMKHRMLTEMFESATRVQSYNHKGRNPDAGSFYSELIAKAAELAKTRPQA